MNLLSTNLIPKIDALIFKELKIKPTYQIEIIYEYIEKGIRNEYIDSYCSEQYAEKIKLFLDSYGSMTSIMMPDNNELSCFYSPLNIQEDIPKQTMLSQKIVQRCLSMSEKMQQTITPENAFYNYWCPFLENHKLGKYAVWFTIPFAEAHTTGIPKNFFAVYMTFDSVLSEVNTYKFKFVISQLHSLCLTYVMEVSAFDLLNKWEQIELSESLLNAVNQRLSAFQNLILAYKHTIFNLFANVTRTLSNVRDNILFEEEEEALKNLEDLDKLFKVSELCSRAIYNYHDKNNSILYDKNKERWLTVIELVRLLAELQVITDNTINFEIIGDSDAINHALNYTPNEKIIAKKFIFLWNFWNNAFKCTDDKLIVTIFIENERLLISFKNSFEPMYLEKAEAAIAYLNKETNEAVKQGGGLWIVKDLIDSSNNSNVEEAINWEIVPEFTKIEDEKYFVATVHLKQ